MVDFNVRPRPQATDSNKQVIQGGTTIELQVMSTTVSNMGAMNFSEIPKSVIFQTRTAANDIEFTFGTTTVPVTASGDFWSIQGGETLTLDVANTGTFYFRAASSSTSPVIIGMALL